MVRVLKRWRMGKRQGERRLASWSDWNPDGKLDVDGVEEMLLVST